MEKRKFFVQNFGLRFRVGTEVKRVFIFVEKIFGGGWSNLFFGWNRGKVCLVVEIHIRNLVWFR
jgi:hypothetical protein